MQGIPAAPPEGDFQHKPVLAAEVLAAFSALPSSLPDGHPPTLLDCTLGGGGHSGLLLAAHPALQLIGLDQDPSARAAAAEALAPFSSRLRIVATNFADFEPAAPLSGVLADLGVSSPQLDVAARGFSFRADAPLADVEVCLDHGLAFGFAGREVFLLLGDRMQLDRCVQVFAVQLHVLIH